jgi:predicted RNA binding protein YcfA (HicA-like mRNA interferase family)
VVIITIKVSQSGKRIVNSRQLIEKIEADGWYLVRTKGSHHHFKHPTKPGLVTIPHPKKDLLAKTANSILKQAQLN